MSMTYYSQANMPRRSYVESGMEPYFIPKPPSILANISFIIGSLLCIFVIIMLSTGHSNFSELILFGCGVILFGMAGFIVYKRSPPSDEQFESWLKNRATAMRRRALRALDVDEHRIMGEVICIQSFVLEGSPLALNYRNNVYMKQGKDEKWRSSVNLFTYIFPMDQYIAVYTGDINALGQSGFFGESSHDYLYRHIISVTVRPSQETVVINGRRSRYRLQKLVFSMTNGDHIEGAYLSALPLDSGSDLPRITLAETGNTEMLNKLRRLIRSIQ